MQSTDAEHVVTTAAVITMVFPVKGIVKDITVGSSTGETINQFVCKIRHELQLNVDPNPLSLTFNHQLLGGSDHEVSQSRSL